MRQIAIICGGRDFVMTASACRWLCDQLDELRPWAILHGAARGADVAGAEVAENQGYGEVLFAFPAEWEKHGKSAGPIRNQEMLTWALRTGYPVYLLAFPGGVGTGHMCKIAEKHGAFVRRYGE